MSVSRCAAQVGPLVVPHCGAAFLCSGRLGYARGAAGGQSYSAEEVGGLPQLIALHVLQRTRPQAGGNVPPPPRLLTDSSHISRVTPRSPLSAVPYQQRSGLFPRRAGARVGPKRDPARVPL